MTERRKEFLRKCQFPLAAFLAIAPIPQIVYVAVAPVLVPFFWVLPLAYFLLALLSFRVPGKFRMAYGVAASVVLAGVGACAMFASPNLFPGLLLLIPAVAYIATMMVNLPMAGWGMDKELPPFWLYCGFATHLGCYAVKFLLKAAWSVNWDAINPCLSITFFSLAILVMLSLTRLNLNNSANGRQKPSAFMQQKNIILTVIFFALAMLIALIPSIYTVIDKFFSWLITTIKDLIENMKIKDVVNDMGGTGAGPSEAGEGIEGLDNLVTSILNALFLLVGAIILLLCLKAIIPIIIRKLRNFFSKLRKGFTSYVSAATEDYIDEVTDLQPAAAKAKTPRLSASEERSLPPAERIRYRYRRLKARHPEWESGSTARENLPEKAAPLYEKARYSSHPITEEDANAFKANTRRF